MKYRFPLWLALVALPLLVGLPARAINENARSCDECKSRCNGKILTYNEENGRTLSANVKAYMEKATSLGAKPESCIRPQYCQNDLLACYHRHGCDGRAARRSKHTDGTACDWKSQYRGTLNRIIHNYPNVIAWHHGNEGGGIHDFTNRYTPSNGKIALNDGRRSAKPAEPVAQPKTRPAPSREPAQSGGAAHYERYPDGRYKCPRGLRSICGSTADTRWCRQWLANGNTAGCLP